MSIWQENGKKDFVVKVPSSHHMKEFETLLRQMLNHYQVPVKAEVMKIPVIIECKCGYSGKVRIPSSPVPLAPVCPDCKGNDAKIIAGKEIEVM